ncbi:ornithine cyclodeaminase family protein [Legionella worsleiensis]|uniref:Ornithine cyclodeaminase n=1 Tax=Legionella worsleiensis TaxID=45076 RepID=A0A0W1AJ69_9GAMM|nr:ornithine cyclodeaminase family protein [Legionella worsleiensis]KTD81393.1 ornithine cyclodeaminase [Legionella worsleiensis]STY30042.1 ornithine cyclodeaminase [Legionella worsleiensis]
MSLRLLSLAEVKQSITMSQAIDAMECAFTQLANQQVKLPLRTGISIDEEKALTLTMPAYLAQEKTLGLKVVSIFPNNLAKNSPSINGFIMLLDASTGQPKVLMDAAYLTALRTGAISGLATKYFAQDNANHAAIIGSGAQSLAQLEAINSVRTIKRVSIWSRNIKNAEEFAKKVEKQYDINVYEQVSQAVRDADIICTVTGSTEPLIHLNDVQPHVHINAIGSHSRTMQEISQDVLGHSVVFVDQLEAVLSESGEIIKAVEQKTLKKEAIIEIGQWLLHKEVDYKNHSTVFKSVGLAIQDLSVAEVVYRNALKNNLGINFSIN